MSSAMASLSPIILVSSARAGGEPDDTRCRHEGEVEIAKIVERFPLLTCRLHVTDGCRLLSSEDAGGPVGGLDLAQVGDDLATPVDGDRTPRVEHAARRRIEGARHLAAQHH